MAFARPPLLKPIRTEGVNKVPADYVGQLTQDFVDSDAVEVRIELEPDGTWTVIATFPD